MQAIQLLSGSIERRNEQTCFSLCKKFILSIFNNRHCVRMYIWNVANRYDWDAMLCVRKQEVKLNRKGWRFKWNRSHVICTRELPLIRIHIRIKLQKFNSDDDFTPLASNGILASISECWKEASIYVYIHIPNKELS